MNLTPHFTDVELGVEFADAAKKLNARNLCECILEPIRQHYQEPVSIHSGYRNPAHNKSVGGKETSYHLYSGGKAAADIHVLNVGIAQLFDWLRGASGLPFDGIILESDSSGVPRCVHVQVDRLAMPRRRAFIGHTGNGTEYTQVAVAPADTVPAIHDPELAGG